MNASQCKMKLTEAQIIKMGIPLNVAEPLPPASAIKLLKIMARTINKICFITRPSPFKFFLSRDVKVEKGRLGSYYYFVVSYTISSLIGDLRD